MGSGPLLPDPDLILKLLALIIEILLTLFFAKFRLSKPKTVLLNIIVIRKKPNLLLLPTHSW